MSVRNVALGKPVYSNAAFPRAAKVAVYAGI